MTFIDDGNWASLVRDEPSADLYVDNGRFGSAHQYLSIWS